MVALGATMTVIDTTIVNVAVHVLGRALDTSLSTVQWVLTGYLLALSMTIPVSGWAVRRFGARTVWLTSLILFSAGSVLCGLAWSAGSLIAFRVLQGVGGGLLMPTAQTMLARAAGPERMARAMAVVSIPAMLAPALGPVLGGLLLDHLSWRWMFLINVPVCVVALVLAVRLLPAGDPEREAGAGLDGWGLALLSPGLALVVYGLAGLAEGGSPVWLPAGAALLVAFALHSSRRRDRALLDLRLFGDRAFATSVGVLFGYSIAAFGALILIPLYAQTVRGSDTLDAGLLVAPLGAGAIVTMALAGSISARFGTRWPSVTGIALVVAGLSVYTRLSAGTGWPVLAVATFVMGLGHGLVTPLAMAGAYRDLPRTAIPGATTAANISVRVGSALGAAVLAIVLQYLSRHTADAAAAFAGSFRWAFGIAAATLLPALLIREKEPVPGPVP
ncbi:DHA2 family efflux MFS transporter permease subunit [Actinoplanes sp. NPDC049265]|uniref:DHA2 family efflux MFS transporter permease subunit n=1 Tax=Actinoplanes sp. NPDC049265 TaxID=3363902 RepID=UPI0037225111